jgi:hypothetical protein
MAEIKTENNTSVDQTAYTQEQLARWFDRDMSNFCEYEYVALTKSSDDDSYRYDYGKIRLSLWIGGTSRTELKRVACHGDYCRLHGCNGCTAYEHISADRLGYLNITEAVKKGYIGMVKPSDGCRISLIKVFETRKFPLFQYVPFAVKGLEDYVDKEKLDKKCLFHTPSDDYFYTILFKSGKIDYIEFMNRNSRYYHECAALLVYSIEYKKYKDSSYLSHSGCIYYDLDHPSITSYDFRCDIKQVLKKIKDEQLDVEFGSYGSYGRYIVKWPHENA